MQVNPTGNQVLGNFIGVDVAGLTGLGNGTNGVSLINSASQSVIGSEQVGGRNVISGNAGVGVLITGVSATQNRVSGNYIGVDVTGAKAVPNNDGVLIASSAFNFIGDAGENARNVISGNNRHGVVISDTNAQGTSYNTVASNFIGLDATGTAAVGNRGHGVWLTQGTSHNSIGGNTPAARNVISGNEGNGIQIENASRTRVLGNFIGTDGAGLNDVGNLQNGVVMAGEGFSEVGGAGAGEGNVIAFNRKNGVLRGTLAGVILSNSIFSNGGLGINVGGSSPSTVNTPLLAGASSAGGSTVVQGTIVSAPKNSFLIQFFSSPACDSSGAGEGKTFIGQLTVAAPDSPQISVTTPFLATLPGAVSPGHVVTATATWFSDPAIDFTRMTSGFSACAPVVSPPVLTVSDLTVVEGYLPNNAVATFTVSLSGAQGGGQPIRVDYATSDGTARAALDYVETHGTLTFNPPFSSGSVTQTVSVTLRSDNEEEAAETFSLVLSNPVNALLQKAQGNCVILDASPLFDAPGARLPDAAASDQKAGSLLIFPVYTSSAASPNSQNTRISLTNAANSRPVSVRMFFVNGSTGAVADLFVSLTPNQTSAFFLSDLDPGVTGFLIAVAVDGEGCPVRHNALLGDEYVKFGSGHAASLGAVSVAALKDAPAPCGAGPQPSQLRFDDVSYNPLPRSVAASNLGDRSTGNDTLLVLNRLGGNLTAGATPLGAVSGLLLDDVENQYGFTFNAGSCQFLSAINSNFPRTNPRFEQVILSGRSGWMKLWAEEGVALCGALITFNGNSRSSAGAFSQGRNLHTLTTTTAGQFTFPVATPHP